jgi:hypothetical protein
MGHLGSAGRLKISAIFLKHPTFEGSFFTLLWTKKYRNRVPVSIQN